MHKSIEAHGLMNLGTLHVSSANIYDDTEVIDVGRSLMYTMNNKGPSILPWGTPDNCQNNHNVFDYIDTT